MCSSDLREISREAKVKTREKVREIVNLKPSISSKEIAEILDITTRAVEYHRASA